VLQRIYAVGRILAEQLIRAVRPHGSVSDEPEIYRWATSRAWPA